MRGFILMGRAIIVGMGDILPADQPGTGTTPFQRDPGAAEMVPPGTNFAGAKASNLPP